MAIQARKSSGDFLRQVSSQISRGPNFNHLRRSRLIHAFYVLALPAYTLLGALIFQALDGDYDDRALEEYDRRCLSERSLALNLSEACATAAQPCRLEKLQAAIMALDECFRSRSYTNFPTHSLSNFANAVIFAASVYTTIGYGNIAADTFECRLATCIYAVVGIPLFFAFLKDMGQLFSQLFIRGWRMAGRARQALRSRRAQGNQTVRNLVQSSVMPAHISIPMSRTLAVPHGPNKVREQRKVFVWAVVFFIIYLIGCSALFWWMEPDWDLWTSFYFLFTSVALVGFGDVFPTEPSVVLINFAFIVLGIVLFGMCYFILQEEIREKAFQASRRVRNSIFKRASFRAPHRKRSMSFDSPKTLKSALKSASATPSPRKVSQDPSGDPRPSSEQLQRRRMSAPNPANVQRLSTPVQASEWSTVV